jgi:glycosyltransferase involved in cell wall biosynthesis
VAAVGVVAGAVVAFHLVKTAGLVVNLRSFPTLRPGDGARPRPATSILVPARDEAARLPRTLGGLLAQPAEEILVLDDGSTDDTAGIVTRAARRDPRIRLLTGTTPPAGWVGKNWACHQLAAAATGEVLVFCDADVHLAPGALDAACAEMRRQRADLFSVFPRQLAPTLGERLLVPLIDENLLAFLPHQLLDAPVPAAAVANGQFLAVTRVAYNVLGGHASVAGRIVEDLALARRGRRVGLRLGLALGGDLVNARMYEGYRTAVRGLGKSMREAHGGRDLVLTASAAFNLVAFTLPLLRWRKDRTWRLAASLGLVERLLVNAKTGRRSYWEAALVPITAPAALPIYRVALNRHAEWKGRRYP